MRESDIVRTVTIKHKTEGVSEAVSGNNAIAASHDKLAAAQKNQTTVSETSARRQASALSGFERLERSVSPAAKALHDYERAQRLVGRAVDQNASLQERGAAILQVYRDRVNEAGGAHKELNRGIGLARHDLINLGRQVQDVGVSLASGQSPLMVAVQQGAQIADVFASSGVSIRAFFSQAIGWGMRFAASTAGVVTGVAAIATGVAAMAASWSSAQREIDKVLSTPGGSASGMSRSGINQIAERGSSSFGLSVAEAREAATAFAATGKIYEGNILRATQITKQFAQAMGMDVGDAAKQIAQDLQSPGAAAAEWAKKIGGINSETVNYIRSLENMGNRQAAITALINAATPGLQKQAEQVSLLTKAYDFAANAVSDWWDRQKRNAASAGDFVTGSNMFGSRSDEERLEQLRGREANLQRSRTPGLDAAALREVRAEIEQIEKKLGDLRAATENQRFDNLSNEMDTLARSINQGEVEIDRLMASLQKLREYQSERSKRGLGADLAVEGAIQAESQRLGLMREQTAALARQREFVGQLQSAWGGVSAQTAVALQSLRDQLNVAQQVTGAGQIRAQQQATVNALLAEGKSLEEASAIALEQRSVSEASATSNVERQTQSLRDQNDMIRARQNGTEATTAAAIAYRTAIESGADATAAAALKAETLKNNILQAASGADRMASEINSIDTAGDSEYWRANDDQNMIAGGNSNSYAPSSEFAPRVMTQRGEFYAPSRNEDPAGYFSTDAGLRPRQSGRGDGSGPNLRFETERMWQAMRSAEAQFLGGSSNNEDKIRGLEMQIVDLTRGLAENPENVWQIRSLERSIEELRKSTDELNETISNVTLNPLYNGRDALRVGYMGAANGLDMMVKGGIPGVDSVPINIMAQHGERVQVTPAGNVSNDNSKTANITIIQNFGSGSTGLRRSRRQALQGFNQSIAAGA